MSDEAKKLTADEQAFWDACVLAALPASIHAVEHLDGKPMTIDLHRQLAVKFADDLLAARRERGRGE